MKHTKKTTKKKASPVAKAKPLKLLVLDPRPAATHDQLVTALTKAIMFELRTINLERSIALLREYLPPDTTIAWPMSKWLRGQRFGEPPLARLHVAVGAIVTGSEKAIKKGGCEFLAECPTVEELKKEWERK
jgi:hypothetical protein